MNVPPGVLKVGRKLKEQAEREHRLAKALNQPPDEPNVVAMAVAPPAKKNAARAKIDRLKAERELIEQTVETVLTDTTAAPEPPEPVADPLLTLRRLSLREAPRMLLVAACLDIIRAHGPQTVDELLLEVYGLQVCGTDDARWLKAQLCKWLSVAGRDTVPKLYPKRHRDPARPNARLHRWGFWEDAQAPDPRRPAAVDNTAVLAAIAELQDTVETLKATVVILSNWQAQLRDRIRSALEWPM